MVIDAARLELAEGDAAQERQQNRGKDRSAPHQEAGQSGDARIKQGLQGEGKGEPRRPLRMVRRKENRKGLDQNDERHIDDARPMHEDAGRRIEPVDAHVEPGLTGEQVSHLDETHGIVGIEEGAGLPDRDGARQGQN